MIVRGEQVSSGVIRCDVHRPLRQQDGRAELRQRPRLPVDAERADSLFARSVARCVRAREEDCVQKNAGRAHD